MESHNGSNSPPLCSRGCGFYGSAEKHNLCSMCYKDYVKEELANSAKERAAPASHSVIADPSTDKEPSLSLSLSTESSTATTATATGGSVLAVKKNRCESCNKKVGLTGFECRCGKILCGVHRYPKEHACTFDFKAIGCEVLAKQNPVVKGDKLDSRI